MEGDAHDGDELEISRDTATNQGVFVYKPKQSKADDERPSKRRKVSSANAFKGGGSLPFVPLLNGREGSTTVQLRHQAYRDLWAEQDAKIQGILDDVDSEVLERVSSFVGTASAERYDGCIPTALVTVGSNVSSLSRLLSRLNERLTTAGHGGVVVVESRDAPNIKTALKNIIRCAVANTEGNDGYQQFLTDRAGPRLLPYDLDLLKEYVERKSIRKLVLALQDSEAFDSALLADLLTLLSSWLDRIPFVLLLGISTTVEIFESKLPRSNVALLKGQHFEIPDTGDCVDRIYDTLQSDKSTRLWLGRNVTGVLFEKSSDYFQSPEAFSRTVKYAYMSHFFANPLSVFLADATPEESQAELCEAARNLPSFRTFCEDLVEQGSFDAVRSLLDNDDYLLQEIRRHLALGQHRMRKLFQAVQIIRTCLTRLQPSNKTAMADLPIRALSGELAESTILGELLTSLRRLDSQSLADLLAFIPIERDELPEFGEIYEELKTLQQAHPGPEPIRSEHDARYSIVQTTVVKQQVRLRKSKAKVPQESVEYTKIVDRLYATAETYFAKCLVRPQDLFLHEIFLFDFRNPLKETFTPRPRYAIERALSNPFDYLVSSSEQTQTKVSAEQPPTGILYQLYLESGSLVNVYDLWHAYLAVFESEKGEECDERLLLTLFYRGLADLKALGLLKSSRKKADHIAKSGWLGL